MKRHTTITDQAFSKSIFANIDRNMPGKVDSRIKKLPIISNKTNNAALPNHESKKIAQ